VSIVLLLVAVPALAQETTTEPPEPSYADKWSQSSPFLDLRNEPSVSSPETPTEPQTPEVDTVTLDGETVAIRDPDMTSDTTPASDTGSVADDSAKSDTELESDPDPVMDTVNDTEPSKSNDQVRNNERDEEATITDTSTEPPTPKTARTDRQPSIFDEKTLFDKLNPDMSSVDLGLTPLRANLGPDTVLLGAIRSDQNLQNSPDFPYESGSTFGGFFWWGIGGVVVTLIIGMFFWFRQPRVKVVKRDYSSAEDFFKERLKNRRKESDTVADAVANAEKQDRIRTGDAVNETVTASDGSVDYQRLLSRLREAGFNGDYETILKMYYRDGLSHSDIVERTSRGRGEVGLVLDYVERLRKG
jgi:hypothetical protein